MSENEREKQPSDDQTSDDRPTDDRSSEDRATDGRSTDGLGIADEDLPADVRPDEDNPLARHPGQTGDDDDAIGADRESEPETAPLSEDDADYGSDSPG